MKPLNRKLWRDLRRHKAQFIAVAVTIFVGVMAFVALYDSYLNLEGSYAAVAEEYRFANITLIGGDSDSLADSLSDTFGVEAVEARTVVYAGFDVGGVKLLGRVVGIPEGSRVNQLEITEGDVPAGRGQILVNQHMAEHFELGEGDSFLMMSNSGWVETTVAGVAMSPEYLWPARDQNMLITSADNFGVVYMPQEWAGEYGDPNQVVAYFVGGEPDSALEEELISIGAEYGALGSFRRAEQASNAALNQDIKGFEEVAFLLPLVFLSVAAMAAYVMINRMVHSHRPQIGVLLANGVSRRAVLKHYLEMGLLPGIIASVAGALTGSWLAGVITESYLRMLAIPTTRIDFRIVTVLIGVTFGVVASVVSSLTPGLSASRIQPAAAMRGETLIHKARRSTLEKIIPGIRKLPIRWRMALRGIERNPRRTVYTLIGVVLSLMVLLVSWGIIDSINHLISRQADLIDLQDGTVYLSQPMNDEELDSFLVIPEIRKIEPMIQVPIMVSSKAGEFDTAVMGLSPDTEMHGFFDPEGKELQLPETGIFLNRGVARRIGAGIGDEVMISVPDFGVRFPERVAGILDEPLGAFAYARIERLEVLAGATLPVTAALITYSEGADASEVRRTLTELPTVTAFEDASALQQTMNEYMALFYGLMGVALAFGAAMAFALIFNSMSVNIAERQREIATLMAVGIKRKSITRLVTAENLLVSILGILPGLLAGYLMAKWMMSTFSSEIFSFDLHINPTTYLVAAAMILGIAAVSQWPGLRAIARLNIPQITKERSA